MTSVRSTRNPMAFLDVELEEMRAKGAYRRLRVVESEQAARCRIDGRDVITLSSNNYLGLTTHPKLREADDLRDPGPGRRVRRGPHHRRHDEPSTSSSRRGWPSSSTSRPR